MNDVLWSMCCSKILRFHDKQHKNGFCPHALWTDQVGTW